MRHEDKPLAKILGICFVIVSFALILFPYWIVLLLGVIYSGIMIGIMGALAGLKDTKLSAMRRVFFLVLGCGYPIGAIIMALRIAARAQETGWLSKFR